MLIEIISMLPDYLSVTADQVFTFETLADVNVNLKKKSQIEHNMQILRPVTLHYNPSVFNQSQHRDKQGLNIEVSCYLKKSKLQFFQENASFPG